MGGPLDWKYFPEKKPSSTSYARPLSVWHWPKAVHDVLTERRRQVEEEGYTFGNDDRYDCGEMASAAAAYATQGRHHFPEPGKPGPLWPWEPAWWKPGAYRRNLVKAGALILAEIERLDRALAAQPAPENLGRFGHHPDPAIDFEVEVQALEGLAYDVSVALDGADPSELDRRIERAMEFRVGGDVGAVAAKQRLREIQRLPRTAPDAAPAPDPARQDNGFDRNRAWLAARLRTRVEATHENGGNSITINHTLARDVVRALDPFGHDVSISSDETEAIVSEALEIARLKAELTHATRVAIDYQNRWIDAEGKLDNALNELSDANAVAPVPARQDALAPQHHCFSSAIPLRDPDPSGPSVVATLPAIAPQPGREVANPPQSVSAQTDRLVRKARERTLDVCMACADVYGKNDDQVSFMQGVGAVAASIAADLKVYIDTLAAPPKPVEHPDLRGLRLAWDAAAHEHSKSDGLDAIHALIVSLEQSK